MDAFALYCLDLTQIQGKQKKREANFSRSTTTFSIFSQHDTPLLRRQVGTIHKLQLQNHDFFFIIVAYQYLHVNKILFTATDIHSGAIPEKRPSI